MMVMEHDKTKKGKKEETDLSSEGDVNRKAI